MGNNLVLQRIAKQNRQQQIVQTFWYKSNILGRPYLLPRQIIKIQVAQLILPIITPRKSIKNDNLSQINNFQDDQKFDYPLAQLQFRFQKQNSFGIGVFIGQQYVMTTATSLVNIQTKQKVNQIFCNLGNTQIKIIKRYIPKAFQESSIMGIVNEQENFAVLKLQKFTQSQRLGYVGIDTKWQDKNQQIVTFRRSNHFQKRVKSKIIQKVKQNKILQFKKDFFTFDTKCQLANGAPILKRSVRDERVYDLIGFYLKKDPSTIIQTALRITERVRREVNQWISTRSFKLNLNQFELQNQDIVQMTQKIWSHIQQIDISQNQVGPQGIRSLMNQSFQNLKILNINDNRVGSEGARLLADKKLSTLEQFYLSFNNIKNQGVKNLASYQWPSLRILQLKGNGIKNQGIQHLVQKPGTWHALSELILSQNRIGDQGVNFLVRLQWASLQNLVLDSNQIQNEGAQYLARTKFPNLKMLSLIGNNIGNSGLQTLYSSKKLLLKVINIDRNYITSQLQQFFSKQKDQVKINGVSNQYNRQDPHFELIH